MTERPTYRATGKRDGQWWAITVHDAPTNLIGVATDRGSGEAEKTVRGVIAPLLGVAPDSFDLDLDLEGER